MMRGFYPREFCPEGAYVLMELCMEGVLSEGVLSEGFLSGAGFVLPSHIHPCLTCTLYTLLCMYTLPYMYTLPHMYTLPYIYTLPHMYTPWSKEDLPDQQHLAAVAMCLCKQHLHRVVSETDHLVTLAAHNSLTTPS